MVELSLSPASRFVATEATASFHTQVGRLKADGQLGDDLTWRAALGATVWIGSRCFYAPLLFWRKLR